LEFSGIKPVHIVDDNEEAILDREHYRFEVRRID